MVVQEFIDGEITREGLDVLGSKYNEVVTYAIAENETSAVHSAYFSETALDPYEVALSKQFV